MENNYSPDIVFELSFLEETVTVKCKKGEYRNLMVLINEKLYVPDFGECRGIGRCGTCLIDIQTISPLPPLDRNEKTTLEKGGHQLSEFRLACQIMIDELLDGAKIRVLEEREDVR